MTSFISLTKEHYLKKEDTSDEIVSSIIKEDDLFRYPRNKLWSIFDTCHWHLMVAYISNYVRLQPELESNTQLLAIYFDDDALMGISCKICIFNFDEKETEWRVGSISYQLIAIKRSGAYATENKSRLTAWTLRYF